ncbi:MAG TPA: hypothetical protein VMM37_09755 [Bacteroidota bacterium]|nr:hypothetical protein [Bacteroidota bacterium]
MPVTYKFEATIVLISLAGEYLIEELRRTIDDALADPGYPSHARLIIDLSRSKSIVRRTNDEIKSVAEFLVTKADRFGHRLALVAAQDLTYGILRMTSVGSENQGVESGVFRSVEEARAWILS